MKKRLKKKIAFNKSLKNWSWYEKYKYRQDILKYDKYHTEYYRDIIFPPITIPYIKNLYPKLISSEILGVQPMKFYFH